MDQYRILTSPHILGMGKSSFSPTVSNIWFHFNMIKFNNNNSNRKCIRMPNLVFILVKIKGSIALSEFLQNKNSSISNPSTCPAQASYNKNYLAN